MNTAYHKTSVFLCDLCGEKDFEVSVWEQKRITTEVTEEHRGLHLAPQLSPWVFRVQLGQLAEQFFRALVARHGDRDRDLDDRIAADVFFRRRRHAFFPQAKLLPGLGAGRNLQQGAAIDGRYFDLRAQRSFCRAHRNAQIDVVAVAPEDGVIPRTDDHVQVPGHSAVRASIPLAWQANALPVARAGFDANLQRLAVGDGTLAVADRAGGQILPGPVAARTLHIELHPAAGLRDLSTTAALRTFARRFDRSLAVTVGAHVLPRDVQPHHAAADCRPEGNVDLIFKVTARLRAFFGLSSAAASTENRPEDIAEAAGATAGAAASLAAAGRVIDQVGEIEPAKVEGNALSAGLSAASRKAAAVGAAAGAGVGFCRRRIDVVGIEPDLIVNLALLGIAQNFVGLRQSLELLLSRFVPGIDVGMVLARKFAKRLADVLGGGRLLYPENLVIVLFAGGCHGLLNI